MLAALGLHCYVQAFSGCERRLLSIAVQGLLVVVTSFLAEHRLYSAQASVVVAHGLSCPTTCGIFRTRDQTHVPCIGRQILNHCTRREELFHFLYV